MSELPMDRALALQFADGLVPRTQPITETLAAADAISAFLSEWPSATFEMKQQALGIAFNRYLADGETASVEWSLDAARSALSWLVSSSPATLVAVEQLPAGER